MIPPGAYLLMVAVAVVVGAIAAVVLFGAVNGG